jgi:hypothetical protein
MSDRKKWSPADPWIHVKKTSFMQRLSDRVRQGATFYVAGQTPLNRVSSLVQKLAQRWPLNLTPMQASRRAKAGHPTYFWIGWLDDDSQLVHWFVLHKPGTEPDRTDLWKCALHDRLTLTGYELVRHTRSGSKAPAWTWRYKKETMDSIRESLIFAIRGRQDLRAEQLIHTLFRSPGFAGVREQVKKMRLLSIAEWKRSRSSTELIFHIPPTIGYVSRLSDRGMLLSCIRREGA